MQSGATPLIGASQIAVPSDLSRTGTVVFGLEKKMHSAGRRFLVFLISRIGIKRIFFGRAGAASRVRLRFLSQDWSSPEEGHVVGKRIACQSLGPVMDRQAN